MKTSHVLLLTALCGSCSAHPPTTHTSARNAPAGADATASAVAAASGEAGFLVVVDSVDAATAALDTAPALDYSLHVNCVTGDANTAVARDFTKAQIDAATVTLPKLAKNCTAYLTQLKVTPAGAAAWSFAPPADTSALSLTYTATAASATVVTTKSLPNPLSATASDNALAFTFSITANAAQTTTTDLGVTAAQIGATASVEGTTPPLFAITAAVGSFSGTVCTASITAQCTNGATNDATGLNQCSGVTLAHLKIYTDANLVAAASVKPNLPAVDSLTFPLSIAGCTPGTSGIYKTTVQVKFVNDSGDAAQNSSLTMPLLLTIKFNATP